MSPERFDHLLRLVGPLITKKNTRFRDAIPAGERLAITLRFLASGDSQISLSFMFRVGRKSVSRIVSETCKAIADVLLLRNMSTRLKHQVSGKESQLILKIFGKCLM